MTREELRALGLTDEQVESVMKSHSQVTNTLYQTITQKDAEVAGLKALKKELDELKGKQEPEPEPKDPKVQELEEKLANMKKEMDKKDIAAYASEKGISGEQAKNILEAFTDVTLAKSAIDSISQMITDSNNAARDDEKKKIQKDTPNPKGDTGKIDDKPEDVKNMETISFGTNAPSEDRRMLITCPAMRIITKGSQVTGESPFTLIARLLKACPSIPPARPRAKRRR